MILQCKSIPNGFLKLNKYVKASSGIYYNVFLSYNGDDDLIKKRVVIWNYKSSEKGYSDDIIITIPYEEILEHVVTSRLFKSTYLFIDGMFVKIDNNKFDLINIDEFERVNFYFQGSVLKHDDSGEFVIINYDKKLIYNSQLFSLCCNENKALHEVNLDLKLLSKEISDLKQKLLTQESILYYQKEIENNTAKRDLQIIDGYLCFTIPNAKIQVPDRFIDFINDNNNYEECPKEFSIGDIEIAYLIEGNQLNIFTKSHDDKAHPHNHPSRTRDWLTSPNFCLGQYSSDIALCSQNNDLMMLLSLIETIVSTVNDEDTYGKYWLDYAKRDNEYFRDFKQCEECGNYMANDEDCECEEKMYCAYCDGLADNEWYIEDDYVVLCDYCFDETVATCEICDNRYYNSSNEVHCVTINRRDKYICSNCLEDYIQCSKCEEYYDSATYVDNEYYCFDCINKLFSRCDKCDEYILNDDLIDHEDKCYCENCYEQIKEEEENEDS